MELAQLLLSAFLGGLIGLERQNHNKQSGIRTMALISLGSCVFSVISLSFPNADPTRVIAQIVTGIGFLGAGIIFKSGMNVYGLTSAATIWCTATVGTLIGIEKYQLGIEVAFIILFLNTAIKKIKGDERGNRGEN
jgi:putative Mg2+ transporter-C (MgtC) family protein